MKKIILLAAALWANALFANELPGLGKVAKNLHLTTTGAAGIMQTFALIIGVGLLTGGVIKYLERRHNPEEVSLGKVLSLLIGGIAFVAIGLISV